MKRKIVLYFFFFAAILTLSGCNSKTLSETEKETQTGNQNNQIKEVTVEKTLPEPTMGIDQSKTYEAVLKTDKGEITISLNAKETPKTVNNFVYLATNKLYDNTIFHRVVKGFMIQGGDPKGNGTGGPGYQFADEPFTGEYKRGTVAMANAGPNTNGSQFFIMHQDYALSHDYVIFGQVTKGMEVVDAIANSEVRMSASGEKSEPVTPVKVESVQIVEK